MRKVDKHYQDLAGIDSRTNPIFQNPKYARGGKNFAYSFQDELKKMNGFQYKLPGSGCEYGLMEYKFQDVNTGQSRTQLLGVGTDGNLNRQRIHRFRITKSGGSVDSYSIFYDNTGTPSWKIVFYDSAGVVLNTIPFALDETLSGLASFINGLGITGITCAVVDETGGTISSTVLSYTLDTVFKKRLSSGANFNEAWFWEQVPKPSSTVTFGVAVAQWDNPDYEGLTWVNANNCIYMTDGGFPMKYDGFSVYRAGVPKTFPNAFGAFPLGGPPTPPSVPAPASSSDRQWSGFSFSDITTPASGTDLPAGTYDYKCRFGFRDANGAITYGSFFSDTNTGWLTTGSGECGAVTVPYLKNSDSFGVFSCRLSAQASWAYGVGPFTISVDSGHNILPGMCLMVPSYFTATTGLPITSTLFIGRPYFFAKVSSVTTTSITVEAGPEGRPGDGIFSYTPDDMVLNGYWVPESQENNFSIDPATAITERPYGFFCEIYRSKVGVFDDYYFNVAVPMPRNAADEYSFYDITQDSFLTEPLEDLGSDLPRACRYLSSFQDFIVQSGRPYDQTLAGQDYPSFYLSSGFYSVNKYTEAHLCDFQSIYWASNNAPEGFPQDGLHEFLVSTKFNDEIRGMIANKDSFFVFKERSTGYLTGTLADNNLALEVLEADVGSACHKVLHEVNGFIFFLDPEGGFWSVVAGRLPIFVGYAIEDQFRGNPLGLNLRKATAANFRKDDKYICGIPGVSSRIFVFDYASMAGGLRRSAWLVWDGIDTSGGVLATADDRFLISSGVLDMLWQQKFSNSKYDYSNHLTPINFVHNGAWINFGLPVIDKTFKKVWVNSIQGGFSLTVKQYANYIDSMIADYTMNLPTLESGKKVVKDYMNVNVDKLSSMSIGFENNVLYDDVRIQGWEIEYAPVFDINEGRK